MTHTKKYYYNKLKIAAETMLKKYIVDGFLSHYGAELNCDIKRYMFPETYRPHKLRHFIRFLENASVGYCDDMEELRELADNFITTDVHNVVTKIRQELTATIIHWYEWSQDDYKDELITINDLWFHYCSMKLQSMISKLTINKLRHIFDTYQPNYDDDYWNELMQIEIDDENYNISANVP
jgi:hypothetical protein